MAVFSWSVEVFLYPVACLYLGQADRLPIVRAIGSVWIWVALSAWTGTFATMAAHLVRIWHLPAKDVPAVRGQGQ